MSRLRFLVAESEPPCAREERRAAVGESSGETYSGTLRDLVGDADLDRVRPADDGARLPAAGGLAGYDAVFLTGSPLHLHDDTPEVRREIDFMRAVFASGTPSFGSCAGLQVATVAAGGRVRPMRERHEAGIARRLSRADGASDHPLLRGRPAAYDALAIHGDEVETLPPDATLLASNRVTAVQAAEIRHDGGVFWGVQYHPELSPGEIAASLRAQADGIIAHGLAGSPDDVESVAALLDGLHADPGRRDLAWRLGVDEQVTDAGARTTELRNFVEHLVRPTRARRGRG